MRLRHSALAERTAARMRSGMTVLAGALLAGGCGPTPGEIGAAVLMASPLIVLALLVLHIPLQRLGSDARPSAPLGERVVLVGAAALAAPALGAAFGYGGRARQLVGLAFLCVGALAWTFDLVLWRARLQRSPRTAFAWAPLVAVAVTCWPAPILMFLGDTAGDFAAVCIFVWVYGSSLGIVPVLIYIGLLVEAATESRKARSARARDVAGAFD